MYVATSQLSNVVSDFDCHRVEFNAPLAPLAPLAAYKLLVHRLSYICTYIHTDIQNNNHLLR